MKPHLGLIDYLVVAAYLAAMVSMGLHFSRAQKSADHYFAGNRRIPAWAVGMSLLATIISSVTFISYPGTAYSSNWLLLVQGLMVPIVLLVMIWWIVPTFRRTIRISTYEYFEKRFSYGSRLYASLAFTVMHFTRMGTVIYLLSLALGEMTGWNIYAVLFGVGISTIFYTLIGGIDAVVWTDVVQGFLFLTGGLVCLGILLFKPAGGPVAVVSYAARAGKLSFRPYDFNFAQRTFWVLAINGIFYAIQKYTTDQTIVQRFLLAKDDRAAIRATLLGTLCVPTWCLFMFIGSCLYSFYHLTNYKLPADLKGDKVFPYFITTQLPAGATGLVLAALLAAAMSALSSDLNCLSAVVVEDYYRRLRPNASDPQRLRVGKFTVAICGLIALSLAVAYVQLGEASFLGTVFNLYAIFSGGLVGLFALAFFSRRANPKGALVGIAACVLFTAWAVLTSPMQIGADKRTLINLGRWGFHQHSLMIGVWSHLVLFAVGYAASLAFSAGDFENRIDRRQTVSISR